ncbi:MAG: gamma-glutamyltransferase [Alphaproteobacteria bacterium]|nr:gamma-glutamyltransferase [Alphaproteobacteria bacterium]
MNQDFLFARWREKTARTTARPSLLGTRHMAVAGHYHAAHAAFAILEAGGNAVDAGCAAGLALGVLIPDIVNVAGVAPILIKMADRAEVISISGLGTWPRAASVEFFQRNHGGRIPMGVLRTVVPAAPAAWIKALEHFGTMSFGDIAAAAIRFAEEGFPTPPLMADLIAEHTADYARWPSSAAVYLPGGRAPRTGEIFRQADLARTLRHMVDQERAAAARGGRKAGLAAARDAFYRGDIAAAILRTQREHDGLMTAEDLSGFEPEIETAASTRFGDIDVHSCGPWCQGPALLQAVNLLDAAALRGLGHNSPDYVHVVTEALKLAFADREKHYGDPRFVDVPLDGLLSADYAARRRALIRMDRAWPGLPPAGDPRTMTAEVPWTTLPPPTPTPARAAKDTSYACVVDRWGNVFSATPSDSSYDGVVVPGTGLTPSTRGSQSRVDAAHPSSVAGGKRPRLTPSPAIAIAPGRFAMPFGTPGGDVQIQAMLQVFLNIVAFGMDPQEAVEAPRFASASFPDSFAPHAYHPGRLAIEQRLAARIGEPLAARGHQVVEWPDGVWRAGSICTIVHDIRTGLLAAGADPRRVSYATGW